MRGKKCSLIQQFFFVLLLLPLFFHLSRCILCSSILFVVYSINIFLYICIEQLFFSLHPCAPPTCVSHIYRFICNEDEKKYALHFFGKQICAIEWHMKVRMKMKFGWIYKLVHVKAFVVWILLLNFHVGSS